VNHLFDRKAILAAIAALAGIAMLTAAHGPGVAAQEGSAALQITRAGAQPSRQGQVEYFTGAVRVDPLASVREPSRVAASYVTFEPGARTAWHTHPLGQTLIVTAGVGWVQHEGGPIEEVRPGDVVWVPPGVKHWHGAAPTTAMTHIAITETLNGKSSEWMEKVGDEQYRR
jgi:quercetin dioxygenase-like cupin family protein